MGAVGKQGILICTKMQLSFATGSRLQGSAGGGGVAGAAPRPPPAGTGEVQRAGKVPAAPSAPAQPLEPWEEGITCTLGLPGAAELGRAKEGRRRRTEYLHGQQESLIFGPVRT